MSPVDFGPSSMCFASSPCNAPDMDGTGLDLGSAEARGGLAAAGAEPLTDPPFAGVLESLSMSPTILQTVRTNA